MKALIDPTVTPISYVSGWTTTFPYQPIISEYPNSCRVAQVEPDNQIFAVAEPLFWTDCPDNCVADQWYFDTATNIVNPVVNAPKPAAPASEQPATTGTQTI
jgi:hypothetical protein